MRVFVSEFITSGALCGRPLPPSLLAEGRAMWAAVIEDLARLDGVTVTTTRDSRVPPLLIAGVSEQVVASAEEERDGFRDHCRDADAVCVIAPELDDELSRRVSCARDWTRATCKHLNAPASVVSLTSDKWETWHCLTQHGVDTVPTALLNAETAVSDWPIVVKPRFGAGSQNTFLVSRPEELLQVSVEFESTDKYRQGIVQPYISGRSLSCVAMHDSNGRLAEIFPVGEQALSNDGRFTYLGGQLPAGNVEMDRIPAFLFHVFNAIRSGANQILRGPIGVDLIECDQTGRLFVVDINPRFTTSYIGYRQLAEHNLLAGLAGLPEQPRRWKSGPISFNVAEATGSR